MKTLLLASAMIVSVASGAHAWDTTINNGGRGGTGYGGAGGAGGMGGAGGAGGLGGAGGSSASQSISAAAASANAAAQSRSGSVSALTVAPGAIGSGNSGGSASVNAAPGFGLPSFGGGQCGIVGFGVAVSPSGGGAFGPAWESTNCAARINAQILIALGHPKEAEALLRSVYSNVDAAFVSVAGAPQPIAYAPARTFDCDKVRHDTGHGRMSDEDMAIYRSCH